MRQEKLVKLLCELIKNSRRSDRDLAKILGFSQPSVSRLRKILEKDAILQYTAIPDFSYLGCMHARLRSMFYDQLLYRKVGLQAVKLS